MTESSIININKIYIWERAKVEIPRRHNPHLFDKPMYKSLNEIILLNFSHTSEDRLKYFKSLLSNENLPELTMFKVTDLPNNHICVVGVTPINEIDVFTPKNEEETIRDLKFLKTMIIEINKDKHLYEYIKGNMYSPNHSLIRIKNKDIK